MNKTFKIQGNDISDGYHTFDELYSHRVHLFVALAKQSKLPCFYKLDYESWFCLYLELPTGQISYHLPNEMLKNVGGFAVHDQEYKWDGHTSEEVIQRLGQWLTNNPGGENEDTFTNTRDDRKHTSNG